MIIPPSLPNNTPGLSTTLLTPSTTPACSHYPRQKTYLSTFCPAKLTTPCVSLGKPYFSTSSQVTKNSICTLEMMITS